MQNEDLLPANRNKKENNARTFNLLTISSHKLVDIFMEGPGFRLALVHLVEVVVAHQVVFGITSHIDRLHT